jgi:hypothetical protein
VGLSRAELAVQARLLGALLDVVGADPRGDALELIPVADPLRERATVLRAPCEPSGALSASTGVPP